MWESKDGSSIETATVTQLVDPIAAAVDSTACLAYFLVRDKLKIVPASGGDFTVQVKNIDGLEGFFTSGSGSRCPSLVAGDFMLLLDKKSMYVIPTKTGEAREIKGSKWCLCANDGETVFLADSAGAIHRAEHGLSHASFPGEIQLVHDFAGTYKEMDVNSIWRSDYMKPFRGSPTMGFRDSGSVLGALWAGPNYLLTCKEHGLVSIGLSGKQPQQLLKEDKSSGTFVYPSALYAVGTSAFAQCPDGIRKVSISGGVASLVLKAREMVFDGDAGSPEPFPKDVIGIDSTYIYFLVERDFFSGMALRRWAHGCKASPEPGPFEMKVTAKKSTISYFRAAASFLRGSDKEEARPPMQNLRVSALGNALETAVAVAARLELDGLAAIQKVQTDYPNMEGSGRGCPQIVIDLKKL